MTRYIQIIKDGKTADSYYRQDIDDPVQYACDYIDSVKDHYENPLITYTREPAHMVVGGVKCDQVTCSVEGDIYGEHRGETIVILWATPEGV